MMHPAKLAAAGLSLVLALASCGSTPQPAPAPAANEVADDTDDGALDLASRTIDLTPTQARALGLSAQASTAPVSVTVAVKLGASSTARIGQKRAYLGFKLNGKDFPADLKGMTSGTYTLALNDAGGALLGKSKNGILKAELDGTRNTSRSRSTAYVLAPNVGTCATATFALKLPGGAALGNGSAPLKVCESVDNAKDALLVASSGLLFLSESDHPWAHAQLTGPEMQQMPTNEEFSKLVGITGPTVEVETRDFAEFFDHLATPIPGDTAQNKAAKKYAALRKVFMTYYRDLRVYRTRDTEANGAEWKIYVLGVNAFGVSGLWTTSIET